MGARRNASTVFPGSRNTKLRHTMTSLLRTANGVHNVLWGGGGGMGGARSNPFHEAIVHRNKHKHKFTGLQYNGSRMFCHAGLEGYEFGCGFFPGMLACIGCTYRPCVQ